MAGKGPGSQAQLVADPNPGVLSADVNVTSQGE